MRQASLVALVVLCGDSINVNGSALGSSSLVEAVLSSGISTHFRSRPSWRGFDAAADHFPAIWVVLGETQQIELLVHCKGRAYLLK